MQVRHYRGGKQVGSVAGTIIKADGTIKAVITAIEERNKNNVRPIRPYEVART